MTGEPQEEPTILSNEERLTRLETVAAELGQRQRTTDERLSRLEYGDGPSLVELKELGEDFEKRHRAGKLVDVRDELPMQPILLDEDGRARFKQNGIVRWLLDAGPFDLNQIVQLPGTTPEELSQFYQLIGYTTDGYAELSFTINVDEVDAIADELRAAQPKLKLCSGPVKSGHRCKLPAGHTGMHEVEETE